MKYRLVFVTTILPAMVLLAGCSDGQSRQPTKDEYEGTSLVPSDEEGPGPSPTQSVPEEKPRALAEVKSKAYDKLIHAVMEVDPDEDRALKTDTSIEIRVDENYNYALTGRFGINASTVKPIICYSDYEEQVSLKMFFKQDFYTTNVIVEAYPEVACEGNNLGLRIETVKPRNAGIVISLPNDIPKNVQALYGELAHELELLGDPVAHDHRH